MRRLLLLLLAVLLFPGTALATAPGPKTGWFTIDVGGSPATGYAVSPSGKIEHLVVVAHGRGHSAASWIPALEVIASHGALAVAMDYSPTFVGIARGGEETAAVARYFQARVPTIKRSHLVGVSMGGVASTIALATSPGLFEQWIAIEPLTSLAETYAEAKFASIPGLETAAATEIENECGGTPATNPSCYQERSAALRVDELARSVKGVTIVHAVEDGLVPYDQGRQLATLLAQRGTPVVMNTVLGYDCRTNDQGNTTIIGYTGSNPGCLAGHARETLTDHVVMRTALQALFALLAGGGGPVGTTEQYIASP